MQYRRAQIPGGAYFFTVVTYQRRPILASEAAVGVLHGAMRRVMAKRPFRIEAMVILPDHLHCIWRLPAGDADFPTRWRLIKSGFSQHCNPALRTLSSPAHRDKDAHKIWQPRYWEHLLRDEEDFCRHREYIHYNPVKHKLVATAREWPYSSFHRDVRAGLYPPDWGGGLQDLSEAGAE